MAQVNPMTHVIETARQGFVGVSWADTLPGLLAALGLFIVGALALREIGRAGH